MQCAEVGIAAVGSVSLPRELRGAREEHTAAAAARRSTRLALPDSEMGMDAKAVKDFV
ncbi:hypothetical protein AALO_G00254860 [Alosa alosa]|uniref:Uncharacterized protein n=1 Tax=Alosa alosa TaxID=278164 RepID=A0AAV6FP33_9TELE|nr:hypothetical protein AALO_G00254860 [Alosa alosa]